MGNLNSQNLAFWLKCNAKKELEHLFRKISKFLLVTILSTSLLTCKSNGKLEKELHLNLSLFHIVSVHFHKTTSSKIFNKFSAFYFQGFFLYMNLMYTIFAKSTNLKHNMEFTFTVSQFVLEYAKTLFTFLIKKVTWVEIE